MSRTRYLTWVAVVAAPMLALTMAGERPPAATPTDVPVATDSRRSAPPASEAQLGESTRNLARNPRPSIEERLARIERLSAQLQEEARELRQDLRVPAPATQPASPSLDGEHVPSVHLR